MNNIYAALEIGTSRTVLAVGEAETGGRLRVTSHAEIVSAGVRKGQIFNIAMSSQSVKSVLKEIERAQLESGNVIDIENAFLVVNGQHVKADHFQGSAQIARRKVTVQDMEEAARSAHSMPLPRDRELLDVIDGKYTVDGCGATTTPEGISGQIIRLDTIHVHADANRINDARTAAGEAKLELRDPLFAAVCAADAVLTDAERRDGALVLDLGGGCTGYAIHADGALVATGAIGVGGCHVTNDIACAFQTTQPQAEELKTTQACAVVGSDPEATVRIQLPGSSPLLEQRTISRHALDTVVNARCRELLAIIRETVEEAGLFHRLHAGVVLTGGGAALRGLPELARRELGAEVRLGTPTQIDGLEDAPFPPSFAAVAGALMYAHRNYEEKSLLQSIFGGFRK